MSEVDIPVATEILSLLDEPQLAEQEHRVAAASPELRPAEVLDRALREAIFRLRVTVNRETMEYLRWKVVVARETARRAIEVATAARIDREAAQDRLSRHYRAGDFSVWSVTEISGNVAGRPGRRCLIFASADAIRRVWDFPENWRDLRDDQLDVLSWNR